MIQGFSRRVSHDKFCPICVLCLPLFNILIFLFKPGYMPKGEDEIHGKSNMKTYITMCKIDGQWEFAACLRKLKQALCINLEGWDGEGDRRKVQKGGDICVPMADSC